MDIFIFQNLNLINLIWGSGWLSYAWMHACMHIIKVVMYLRSKPTTSIFVCHGPSIFGGSHRAELEWSRNCSSAKMLLIERHQLCFGKSSHHHQRRLNLRRIESVYTMYISYQLSIYVFSVSLFQRHKAQIKLFDLF